VRWRPCQWRRTARRSECQQFPAGQSCLTAALCSGRHLLAVAVTHVAPRPKLAAGASSKTFPQPSRNRLCRSAAPAAEDSRKYACSFVEEKSRIFRDIPIPEQISRCYASNRVELRQGSHHRSAVKPCRQAFSNHRAGGSCRKTFQKELPPKPNQTAYIEWDGLDHGRMVAAPFAS
jgi:hypothetical protein